MTGKKRSLQLILHDGCYESMGEQDLDDFENHLSFLTGRPLEAEPKSLKYFCDILSGKKEIPRLKQHTDSHLESVTNQELMLMEIAATLESFYTEESLDFSDTVVNNLKLLLKELKTINSRKSLESRAQLISELSIYTVARAIEIKGEPPKLKPRFNK